MNAKPTAKSPLTPEQVRAFLKENPSFIADNSDIVTHISPPRRELGGGVLDFQHFMVKNLQKDSKDLKSKYELLIDFCRENMSVQSQVHHAVLRLIRTRGLEQLLEVISLDLVSLFDVDVVRLAMESEIPIDTSYGEANFSGIVFIEPGTIDAALGIKKQVLLMDDCTQNQPAGYEQIFSDCNDMIASCAMLRLELEMIDRQVLLAFGVRHKDRFHPKQGIELLNFLAQIVAHQLDRYLIDLTV